MESKKRNRLEKVSFLVTLNLCTSEILKNKTYVPKLYLFQCSDLKSRYCFILPSQGMTALHYCCSSGYLDAAKLLLEHGAFPNHMEYSEERLTPLDYALQNEHHHVAQYMLEQGALSITGIRDIAAIRVQAYFRGYRVRKTFVERKKLLMKHEQLRKDAAK